jgi:hypothetical protein
VYSINATFVASCNTTQVRSLDVKVPRPYTNINAKRISITGIYFFFYLGGIEMTDWMNLLCWYIFIINAMRSCSERTTNCQNRPSGKEFNTTAFVNLLICNVNVNIILWRNLNIVSMKLFRIYFAFFFGGEIEMTDSMNLLCWYIFIINAMRSYNERTIIHCLESYLYYVILVNKKIFSEEWNERKKKIDNIFIHCRKYKIYIYEFWRVFLTCFAASGNELYIFRQYTYIVSIVVCQKHQSNCQIV